MFNVLKLTMVLLICCKSLTNLLPSLLMILTTVQLTKILCIVIMMLCHQITYLSCSLNFWIQQCSALH